MHTVDKPTSFQSTKAIIETLQFKRISRNDKGEFWEIFDSYLAVESKLTERSKIPHRFHSEGWYRFFDKENVGPTIGISQQTVLSNDEAKMRLLEMASSDIFVDGVDDCADPVDAIPSQTLHHFIKSNSHRWYLGTIRAQTRLGMLAPI